MQQLLNLTESTESFVRTGGKGSPKEWSLGARDGTDGEFSRLMMQQSETGKEFQQAQLMSEQEAIKKELDDEGRRNVGGPIESNLFELLQEMQQQMAEVSSEGGEATLPGDDVTVPAGIEEAFLEKSGEIELSDIDLETLLAVFMEKLSNQQSGAEAYSSEQRQQLADTMLKKMTDEQKQQLMDQLSALSKESVDAADQAFLVQLLESVMPKSDAEKLLVGKDQALAAASSGNEQFSKSVDGKPISHALLAALQEVKPESTQASLKTSDASQLIQQLEAQLEGLKENRHNDGQALTAKERGKLEQLMTELRQLMAGSSDSKESLTKEQAAKAEQQIAHLRQMLKQNGDNAAVPPEAKPGKSEFAISATDASKGQSESKMERLATGSEKAKAEGAVDSELKGNQGVKADAISKTAENVQVNQAFRNTVDALSDANAAQAIQGQMVSTSQGTVAASESSQANTLQALQRPLDLQQTEASQKLQERINIMMSKNIQRADIRLDPPELGNVHIRVNMSGEQTTVQFQVQNAQAREALESAMPRLREMMEQQGLHLADTQVGEQSQQSSGQGNGGGASGSEGEHWAQESEIALHDGQVVTDGRVDFYV